MIKFVILYFIIGLIHLCCYIIYDYRCYSHHLDPDDYISNLEFLDYVACFLVLALWPSLLCIVLFMSIIQVIGRYVLMIFNKRHRKEKENDNKN